MSMMEEKSYYNVYITKQGKKELIATYSDPHSAHEAARRYNTPHTYITIEKTSKPHSEVGNY